MLKQTKEVTTTIGVANNSAVYRLTNMHIIQVSQSLYGTNCIENITIALYC